MIEPGESHLRLHAVLPRSRANGPGLRTVVWVQGCTLACKGCFNPQTHAPDGGQIRGVRSVVDEVVAHAPEVSGLTLSGGEPFQQPGAVHDLLVGVRARTRLSVLVFSGYRLEEILRIAKGPEILTQIDVLVAGRYVPARSVGSGLLGSANQKIHLLSDRYTLAEVTESPAAEIQIDALGRIAVTGIAPPAWL